MKSDPLYDDIVSRLFEEQCRKLRVDERLALSSDDFIKNELDIIAKAVAPYDNSNLTHAFYSGVHIGMMIALIASHKRQREIKALLEQQGDQNG